MTLNKAFSHRQQLRYWGKVEIIHSRSKGAIVLWAVNARSAAQYWAYREGIAVLLQPAKRAKSTLLPHYYNQPLQPSEDDVLADRTLMKVGKSDADVIRFRQTGATSSAIHHGRSLSSLPTSTTKATN